MWTVEVRCDDKRTRQRERVQTITERQLNYSTPHANQTRNFITESNMNDISITFLFTENRCLVAIEVLLRHGIVLKDVILIKANGSRVIYFFFNLHRA